MAVKLYIEIANENFSLKEDYNIDVCNFVEDESKNEIDLTDEIKDISIIKRIKQKESAPNDGFFYSNILRFFPSYDRQLIASNEKRLYFIKQLGYFLDVISEKVNKLLNFTNIDKVPDEFLPYIAYTFGLQVEEISLQGITLRELIQNLINLYKIKSTNLSFDILFSTLGYKVEIDELFWEDEEFFKTGRKGKKPRLKRFDELTPEAKSYLLDILRNKKNLPYLTDKSNFNLIRKSNIARINLIPKSQKIMWRGIDRKLLDVIVSYFKILFPSHLSVISANFIFEIIEYLRFVSFDKFLISVSLFNKDKTGNFPEYIKIFLNEQKLKTHFKRYNSEDYTIANWNLIFKNYPNFKNLPNRVYRLIDNSDVHNYHNLFLKYDDYDISSLLKKIYENTILKEDENLKLLEDNEKRNYKFWNIYNFDYLKFYNIPSILDFLYAYIVLKKRYGDIFPEYFDEIDEIIDQIYHYIVHFLYAEIFDPMVNSIVYNRMNYPTSPEKNEKYRPKYNNYTAGWVLNDDNITVKLKYNYDLSGSSINMHGITTKKIPGYYQSLPFIPIMLFHQINDYLLLVRLIDLCVQKHGGIENLLYYDSNILPEQYYDIKPRVSIGRVNDEKYLLKLIDNLFDKDIFETNIIFMSFDAFRKYRIREIDEKSRFELKNVIDRVERYYKKESRESDYYTDFLSFSYIRYYKYFKNNNLIRTALLEGIDKFVFEDREKNKANIFYSINDTSVSSNTILVKDLNYKKHPAIKLKQKAIDLINSQNNSIIKVEIKKQQTKKQKHVIKIYHIFGNSNILLEEIKDIYNLAYLNNSDISKYITFENFSNSLIICKKNEVREFIFDIRKTKNYISEIEIKNYLNLLLLKNVNNSFKIKFSRTNQGLYNINLYLNDNLIESFKNLDTPEFNSINSLYVKFKNFIHKMDICRKNSFTEYEIKSYINIYSQYLNVNDEASKSFWRKIYKLYSEPLTDEEIKNNEISFEKIDNCVRVIFKEEEKFEEFFLFYNEEEPDYYEKSESFKEKLDITKI